MQPRKWALIGLVASTLVLIGLGVSAPPKSYAIYNGWSMRDGNSTSWYLIEKYPPLLAERDAAAQRWDVDPSRIRIPQRQVEELLWPTGPISDGKVRFYYPDHKEIAALLVENLENMPQALGALESRGYRPVSLAPDDSASWGCSAICERTDRKRQVNEYAAYVVGPDRSFKWQDSTGEFKAETAHTVALRFLSGAANRVPEGVLGTGLSRDLALVELVTSRNWDLIDFGDSGGERFYFFRRRKP